MKIISGTGIEEKILEIKKDGVKHLHVLSDFDRTLTQPTVNSKDVPSLISVLRDHGYLTPDYPEKAKELYATYHPKEIDPQIPLKEKKLLMEEWWRKHFALLIASGLTRNDIAHAMQSRHAVLRNEVKELLHLLHQYDIPLIIMSSSGLGTDSIHLFLKNENLLLANIHIISNQFIWDNNGKALQIKEPIIHGMNKDETMLNAYPDIFARIRDRHNILLLGDGENDLGMVTGFPYKHLITIGFVDKTENAREKFDITLPKDGDASIICELIQKVVN